MTVLDILVVDQHGNHLENVNIRIIDYIDVVNTQTGSDGHYISDDLPFPTAFMGSDHYTLFADYWTTTRQVYADWFGDVGTVTLQLPLYEEDVPSGEGDKTLTLIANPTECSQILAVNNTQETSYLFSSFPASLKFNSGDNISLTAYPQPGYEFADWADDFEHTTEDNPVTDTWVEDGNLTAVFNFVGTPESGDSGSAGSLKLTVVLGVVFVPSADVVSASIHLGGTKEVSSFELLLQNWNGKYSPNGWYPIIIGSLGGIGVCRAPNNSSVVPLISLKVEKIEYQASPCENYVKVSGRCWGEKLFRRTVTATYANVKGEVIVKDLLNNYVGLSHSRHGVELIENTDTTYTKLEYTDTPVWDILTFIAKSADKNGVIGFDFRVAPDGKFEFFPVNSKSNAVSLGEALESGVYSKDVSSIRNKVTIYGAAEKCTPTNKDALTEILSPTEGSWSCIGDNVSVAQDSTVKALGNSSVKCWINGNGYGKLVFTFNSGYEVDSNLYPKLSLFTLFQPALKGWTDIALYDTTNKKMSKSCNFKNDGNFSSTLIDIGEKVADSFTPGLYETGFDWSHIKKVEIICWANTDLSPGWGGFWVDGLFFTGRRFSSVQQDFTSQSVYGLREYVDTDEELCSDNECELRADAVLAQLKDPAESLTIQSTVVDYGTIPALAGDKVHVALPNEGVDADFRVVSADVSVDSKTQELMVSLELGRQVPMLADWVYALRSKVNQLNRLKIAR